MLPRTRKMQGADNEGGKIILRDAACRVSPSTSITRRRRTADRSVSTEAIRIQSTFAENIGSTHDGILGVRPRVALETQSVLKIEGDHRLFRELKHEVAQCADGELPSNAATLRFAQLRMTRIHF